MNLQTHSIQCRCGHKVEGIADPVMAEVIADRHESSDVRRPHRHGQARGVQYRGESIVVAELFWTNAKEVR